MTDPATPVGIEPPAEEPRPIAGPRAPRHTAGEFAFQLATITAGVLIALSIDGVLVLYRERALVREAHAAMAREIDANLRDLEGVLPALDAHRRHLEQALRFADDLLRTGRTDVHELQFGLNIATLNRASWQTAERTGALSHMEYDEVRTYAELYELQGLVTESQQRLIVQLANLTAIAFSGEGGDPHRSRPRDLEVFRLRVLDAAGAVSVHRTLAGQLVEAYRATAASRR
jgi:hypothetical protein